MAEAGYSGDQERIDYLLVLRAEYQHNITDYESAMEKMVAYDFVGKRYDVGDKLGFLQATVEYGLRDDNLGADFKRYLETLLDAE